jgi:lambda family phage portal protein
LRPGQTRGIPYLAPVIEPLKQLGRYSAAELQAAVIGSYLTVFIQTESGNVGLAPMEPTTETGGKKTDKDYKLASGAILELAQGEKIETVDPKRPNTSFDPFVQAILRQVGVALGIPFELLIMHFTKSYSAARSAMLNAWKVFSTRREWLINHFCDIVYEAWMEEAILRGRIVAPGFLDDPMIAKAYLGNIWIGPAPGQIDPTKEVQAAVIRIDNGLSTRAEETAALSGQDWDDKITQMKKEKRIMKEINGGTSPKPVIEDPDEPDMDPNIEVDGDEESEETDTAEGENENE